MYKIFAAAVAALTLAGCSTNAMYDPDSPRLPVRVVQYQPGMEIPTPKPHIDARGNINSMYEPTVHCHTLHHPGKQPQKVCRIVR